ncbi:DUF3024 domain-containing protein [Geoalkalibacter halelectricus]|uniref:DUF3024 domain-containing protein n=1 Tax=Geoalkalibacter halelectricus TaxID=2847045 RepID=A0ABY5ZQC2_9BACT|nr:DUF3024 domain-containing protein [Geoalkalibacter halelectricus]MDO3378786.1 DUF3024 domain-containing protein [Geoalkalibacter halelectricus]UWZ79909.1 DUF3024 domain-containing protein [Geoalkalibacter halelectricus]
MNKHPNEFSRRIIEKFFSSRHVEVSVTHVSNGYVVFVNHISHFEACAVDEPVGRLLFDERRNEWDLYWISGDFRWHHYASYDKLHQALEVMFGDQAANLFHKVL